MLDYREYIWSPAWTEVKRRYRTSGLPQDCYICGADRVDLHHKTYKRLGRERLTDLLPLCREHHSAAHRLLNEQRARGANRSKWNLWTAAKRLKRTL